MANECKRCGAPGVILDLCIPCLKAIVYDWEQRQTEPIDLEVVRSAVIDRRYATGEAADEVVIDRRREGW